MELKINPEYKSLMPELPEDEYESLKQNISKNGYWEEYPIVVNDKYEILDGHTRWKICQELGIEPTIKIKHFKSKEDEMEFVIEANLSRRHLNAFQRAELALKLIELEKRKRGRKSKEEIFAESAKITNTWEDVEKKVNVSHDTVEKAKEILEKGDEELIEKCRQGEVSVAEAYRKVKNEEKELERLQIIEKLKEKAKTLQTPEDLFDVVVIDPPWNYGTEYDPEGRRCASPYPEMSIEELKQLNIPANENCVLWLWTTNAFMHDAFHLLEAWKFEPKTILTWVKDKMGLGDWLRGQTEHCILAVKGKPVINLTNQTTVLYGKTSGHSCKPEEFYSLVDSLCYGRKLDYFARKEREGWVSFGTKEFEGGDNE